MHWRRPGYALPAMQRVCEVVGNDPLYEELNVEIVSKSKAAHTSCTCNLHKHINITRYITEPRAPAFATAMERNLGLIPVLFFTKKKKTIIAKKNNPRKWFQISFQLAVTSWWDCPCFCLAESCFSEREKLPPSWNLLGGTFTGKH